MKLYFEKVMFEETSGFSWVVRAYVPDAIEKVYVVDELTGTTKDETTAMKASATAYAKLEAKHKK